MERSGSQKALLVLSIIELIGGALALIMGILGMIGAGAVASDPSLVAGSGVSQADATGVIGVVSIVIIISGIWSILCGIFGIRAANDNQKIMIVWVFTLIGVILAIVGIIMAIINGTFGSSFWSLAGTLVFSGIMFFIANNIKNEAGR